MSGTPTVSLRGVGKRFGARKVSDQIDFDVAAGEVVCLLGASGSGKSTILRMIAGIERADEGVISVGGVMVDGPDAFVPPERRQVGLVFQDLALFPHLDAMANVAFGLFREPRAEARVRASDLLSLVGLADHARKFPHQLSGGEQQRLAVARALAPRPQAMLLDEPFSGLDDRLRDGVRREVLGLLRGQGAATVFVTHDPDEALRSADRIVLLRDGLIVQQGAPEALLAAPADLGAAAFFSALNRFAGEVRNGVVETPFGPVAAAGRDGGQQVVVTFRPRDLVMSADGTKASVTGAGLASDGLHVSALLADGDVLDLIFDADAGIHAGDVIRLAAKPGRGLIFDA